MIYIVAYDIKFDRVNDKKAAKRLNNLSKLLQNYGLRRQKSLFECDFDHNKLQELKKAIRQVINTNVDSIRIYPLCNKCLKKTIIQGIGEIIEIKPYEII